VISGKNLVNLNPNEGQSAAGDFSRLGVAVTPAGLEPGTYYALVRVSDPAAASSPQYVTIVLEVTSATAPASLDPSPQGLFFVGESGAPPTASQPVRLFVSSATPVAFQASASTVDGADWLSVTPTKGVTSTQSTAQLAVVANPANLKPGIYTGDVTVALASGEIRTTNITIVVPSGSGAAPPANASAIAPRAGTCSPSKLSLTQTGLINSFTTRAGWPVPVIVRLADDCGDPVRDASVVASFSNGDLPLSMPLTNSQVGLYSATWTPATAVPSTSVTVRAASHRLESATSVVIGAVTTNPLPPPILLPNGVLDNFNPSAGSPLAPGSMARAYGTDLAGGPLQAPAVPLINSLGGTSLLIGGYEAPLYYVSPGQVNVQIPVELESNRQHTVIVSANGQYSVSNSLTLAPAQPGLLTGEDGMIIAHHAADFTLVSDGQPAKAGETIVVYLSGMGPTSPAIASGSASTDDEPAPVQIVPTVTIDGNNVPVLFAGLSPGLVGVYQVKVRIPAGSTAGRLPMVVTQNDVPSNVAMLPVAN
jgi:adhesin/invasin